MSERSRTPLTDVTPPQSLPFTMTLAPIRPLMPPGLGFKRTWRTVMRRVSMARLQTKGTIATQLCRMQKPGKGGVDGEHSGGQPGRPARETKGSPPGVLSHSTAAVGSSLHHTLPSTDSQPSSPTACRLWTALARLCPSTSRRADVVCSTTPQCPTASRARPLASGTTYVPLRTSGSDPFWVNTRSVTASRR